MGTGITHTAAEKGIAVHLHNVNPVSLNAAHHRIAVSLETKMNRNKLTMKEKDSILERIKLFGDLEEAVRDADFIIEAVYERLDTKLKLLSELNKISRPEAVIASNTSTLSITDMAKALDQPGRFIGMHFFSPATVMRLVEVVRGESTSEATLDDALKLAGEMGKTPIVVKDIPGFIVNRFLGLMHNEAAHMVEAGVATPEDIDKALRLGANHPMGILEIVDYTGVDIGLNALDNLYAMTKDERYKPAQILRDMVAEGRYGVKASRGYYDYK
jgi:3-hydroxybutyryl-CoA dehydrogenase